MLLYPTRVSSVCCLSLYFDTDRQVVAEHLPLAWTRSSAEEEALLMSRLEQLAKRFSSPPSEQSEAI